MMQAHYRSTLDFTSEALSAAEKGHARLMDAMQLLDGLQSSIDSSLNVQDLVSSFYTAMNDDFNAPILVANLFEGAKYINSINDGKATISKNDLELLQKEMNAFVVNVLGIKSEDNGTNNQLEPVMDLILDLRQQARTNKDWTTSDKIRDGLDAAGITVKDSKEGSSWK